MPSSAGDGIEKKKQFLSRIELKDDPFLDSNATEERPTLIGAFSAVVGGREFSRKGEKDLTHGTTKEAQSGRHRHTFCEVSSSNINVLR